MPYLKIQTNVKVEAGLKHDLLKAASQLVAKELGKPEDYVAVAIQPGEDFIFGGTDEPAAFVELKSLGFPGGKAKHLSGVICKMLKDKLQIDPGRVYIEMSDHPASFWGWNSSTF